jgi:hypothetical protein
MTADAWDILRRHLTSAAPGLYPLQPPDPATCAVCRGPVGPGFARCYQCGRHARLGRGLLADAVVPIAYAIKGTALAADLWQYKSLAGPSPSARTSLRLLLLTFLHDHGECVWRHAGLRGSGLPGAGPCRSSLPGAGLPVAGLPVAGLRRAGLRGAGLRGAGLPGAGLPGPGRLAVVPTGCGRPGSHPLLGLVSPYLRLPLTQLVMRPGSQGRDLDVNRFRTDGTAAGARVLLLDDSWVSGASAQSAAAALKLAGARQVAIVVLGRHLDPAEPLTRALAARLVPARYDPSKCAVHPKLDLAVFTGQSSLSG